MDICFLAQKFFSLENKRYICPKQLVNVTNGNTLFFFSHRIAVGSLAQKRLARGIKLNYIESCSMIITGLVVFNQFSESLLVCVSNHIIDNLFSKFCNVKLPCPFKCGNSLYYPQIGYFIPLIFPVTIFTQCVFYTIH